MRIVFIGCVKSSEILLDALLNEKADIVGIITKEASGENADFCSLKPLAQKNNIDCFLTADINDKETEHFIRLKKPDIIYCFGWSRLIKKNILSIPAMGTVGFHPAALPCNRGRHPLIWALALGLEQTASTFFIMDENADTGNIISQQALPVAYEDDASTLYHKVLHVAKKQVTQFTREFEQGKIIFIPQNPDRGNVWRKRGKPDGRIDWRMSGRAIYNLVRALTLPYAGAHFMHGGTEVKVWKTEEIKDNTIKNIEPGKVLKVNSKNDFYVKAYDEIIHVQNCDDVIVTEGEYLT